MAHCPTPHPCQGDEGRLKKGKGTTTFLYEIWPKSKDHRRGQVGHPPATSKATPKYTEKRLHGLQNLTKTKQDASLHLQIAPIAVAPSMQTKASSELTITPATLSPLLTPAARSACAHLQTWKITHGDKRRWLVVS